MAGRQHSPGILGMDKHPMQLLPVISTPVLADYPVKLTVQSNLGCTDSYTDNLKIGATGANSNIFCPRQYLRWASCKFHEYVESQSKYIHMEIW